MVGKATPDRGGPRKSPDGVDPKTSGWESKRTRKTQRDGHNSGVKIWSLCSVSSTLSHANLWTTLSNPCNKVRGKHNCKEVFLRLPSFMRLVPASFIMRLLSLRRYVSSIYMYATDCIRCPHKVDIHKPLLVDYCWCVTVEGSLRKRCLWVRRTPSAMLVGRVHLAKMVCEMRDKWPYILCFVGCCFHIKST